MTETNDSQPSADLPLWGRVELDLLAGEVALWDFEIAELEYPSPADNTARCDYLRQLVTAAQAGLLGDGCQYINRSPWSPGNMAYRDERLSSWRIPREAYRQWRATQPNPPTGFISLWFGATMAPQGAITTPAVTEPREPALADSVPNAGATPSLKLRPEQTDKLDCQAIAKRLLDEGIHRSKLKEHPEIAPYARKYLGRHTLASWFAEVDPRPKGARSGRPRKT